MDGGTLESPEGPASLLSLSTGAEIPQISKWNHKHKQSRLPLLLLGEISEATEDFGRGTLRFGSSRGADCFVPKAMNESGSCWVILALGPLVPVVDLPRSILNYQYWLVS